MDQLNKAWGLRCASGDFSECTGNKQVCSDKAGFYLNRTWDRCPVREVLDCPRMTHALSLERFSKISPLANWPNGYPAWVPDLMHAIAVARDDRARHERRS